MQEIAILQTKILTLKMENTSVKALTVKNSTKIRRCAIFCDLQIFGISYIIYGIYYIVLLSNTWPCIRPWSANFVNRASYIIRYIFTLEILKHFNWLGCKSTADKVKFESEDFQFSMNYRERSWPISNESCSLIFILVVTWVSFYRGSYRVKQTAKI